jgi:hypothetical protein
LKTRWQKTRSLSLSHGGFFPHCGMCSRVFLTMFALLFVVPALPFSYAALAGAARCNTFPDMSF